MNFETFVEAHSKDSIKRKIQEEAFQSKSTLPPKDTFRGKVGLVLKENILRKMVTKGGI